MRLTYLRLLEGLLLVGLLGWLVATVQGAMQASSSSSALGRSDELCFSCMARLWFGLAQFVWCWAMFRCFSASGLLFCWVRLGLVLLGLTLFWLCFFCCSSVRLSCRLSFLFLGALRARNMVHVINLKCMQD